MSRASIYTKLPLATWAKIMGLHPLHFEQVRIGEQDPHCDHIYFQFPWQTADHVSREEIAQAIAEAENRIETQLGYHLAPTWDVDEWREVPRLNRAGLVNLNAADSRGFRTTVQAKFGYFISGGVETKTLIDADAAIVYTDRDNDSYFETATVTVPTTVTDPREIAIYYPGHEGDDAWEIRPTQVRISGGNAVITFRRELVVIEEKLELFDIEGGEAIGTDDGDFLEVVDVYRHWNDPQTQATFLWEPMAGGWCGVCNGSGCETCSFSAQSGCLVARGDPRQSILSFGPADWSADDNNFSRVNWAVSRQPDIARLYYYSGWQDKRLTLNNRMDPEWERIVAYYAAALLDRPPCDCAKGDWSRWRQDLTIVKGDDEGLAVYREPGSGLAYGVFGDTGNPFGTRRGQVNAWLAVKHEIIGHAVHI